MWEVHFFLSLIVCFNFLFLGSSTLGARGKVPPLFIISPLVTFIVEEHSDQWFKQGCVR